MIYRRAPQIVFVLALSILQGCISTKVWEHPPGDQQKFIADDLECQHFAESGIPEYSPPQASAPDYTTDCNAIGNNVYCRSRAVPNQTNEAGAAIGSAIGYALAKKLRFKGRHSDCMEAKGYTEAKKSSLTSVAIPQPASDDPLLDYYGTALPALADAGCPAFSFKSDADHQWYTLIKVEYWKETITKEEFISKGLLRFPNHVDTLTCVTDNLLTKSNFL